MRAIRFAVLSDTHGDESIQEGIFQRYAEKVDFWFHCGDGELPRSGSSLATPGSGGTATPSRAFP